MGCRNNASPTYPNWISMPVYTSHNARGRSIRLPPLNSKISTVSNVTRGSCRLKIKMQPSLHLCRINGQCRIHRPFPAFGAHVEFLYPPTCIGWGDHNIYPRSAAAGAWWDANKKSVSQISPGLKLRGLALSIMVCVKTSWLYHRA